MADFEITSPDGKKFVVTAPEGATQEQVLAYAQGQFKSAPPAQEPPQGRSLLRKNAEALGGAEALTSLATGAVAAPIAGLAGIAGSILPGRPGQGAAWTEGVQGALTYQPRTDLGQTITGAAAYPFEKLAEGARAVGNSVVDATGSPALATAVDTAIQSVPAVLGKAVGGKAPLARAETRAVTERAAAADHIRAVQEARADGYSIPPTQANRSLTNQAVEGFAGEAKVAKLLSHKNQPITDNLVRGDFGIAKDAPLTPDVFQAIRKRAGQQYEAVKSTGNIVKDEAYYKDARAVGKKYREIEDDFPTGQGENVVNHAVVKEVNSLVEGGNMFRASTAVEKVKLLREKADKAYRDGEKSTGAAYKELAGILEDRIERHLVETGQPKSIVDNYKSARKTIAKTYAAENALDNGHIDARYLARQLDNGAALDGGMLKAAKFANKFPKAAVTPEKAGGVPFSLADVGVGAGSAIAMMDPTFLAMTASRPALRYGIASGPGQSILSAPPTFRPGALPRSLAFADDSALTMGLLQAGNQ